MTKPVGPYTPVVRAGDLLFVSGQIGITEGATNSGPVTGTLAEGFAARCLIGDDALTAAVTTLGLYWTARSKLDVGPPLALSIDGQALSLTLSPPPKPKLGGRKRRMLPRLPSVAVSFI